MRTEKLLVGDDEASSTTSEKSGYTGKGNFYDSKFRVGKVYQLYSLPEDTSQLENKIDRHRR
jgi:hypothetical protein